MTGQLVLKTAELAPHIGALLALKVATGVTYVGRLSVAYAFDGTPRYFLAEYRSNGGPILNGGPIAIPDDHFLLLSECRVLPDEG